MLKSSLLLLLTTSVSLASGGGLDLPLYIPRCSLLDPKLCECLVENANKVIPVIIKGDPCYHIPPMFPVIYPAAAMIGTDLTYVLYQATSYSWIKLVTTEISIDLENGKFTLVSFLDRLEITAQNYTIIKGKILGIPASGWGRYNSTMTGVKITFRGRIRFYKKGKDVYLDYFDSTADTSCEHASYNFENLHTFEECDVQACIRENGKKFFLQTKSAYDTYFDAFLNHILVPILSAIPFKKIFLP